MLKFLILLQNFLAEPIRRDDRGATAVEYGLIVALIAGVIIITVGLLGQAINGKFAFVLSNL